METKAAVTALAALAQDSRLAVFRALVQAGPVGLAAGKISELTGIPVDLGTGGLNQTQRTYKSSRQWQAAHREIIHRTLGLRAVQRICRHLQLTHAVFLDTVLRHADSLYMSICACIIWRIDFSP